jgi:hypothetical protein
MPSVIIFLVAHCIMALSLSLSLKTKRDLTIGLGGALETLPREQ